MGSILISGFEPFDGDAVNPSWSIATALDGRELAGHRVKAVQLPVVFGLAAQRLQAAIRSSRPAMVLALGLAAGRHELSIERFALNHADARIPDNAGQQPKDSRILDSAPLAYATSLPVAAILARLRAQGIPVAASLSAGAYVCNDLFFRLMHALAKRKAPPPAGFVHVPYASEQLGARSGVPSLPLATLIQAVAEIVEASVAPRDQASACSAPS